MNRGAWIGTGVAAVLLIGAGAVYERRIEESDAAILAAIAPVILAGAIPQEDEAMNALVANFQKAVAGLTPSVQDEVAQLFTLLRVAPLRMLATGVMHSWGDASPAEIGAFLTRWRFSDIAKLRSAYDALHQLVLASWYGDSASWARIGYPGPPAVKL